MKLKRLIPLATALLLVSPFATAEVLLLEAISQEPPNSEQGLLRPARSMTMEQVKARFGNPATAYSAVGEPPITRWDYTGYSVFFEHNLVLNVVVHR